MCGKQGVGQDLEEWGLPAQDLHPIQGGKKKSFRGIKLQKTLRARSDMPLAVLTLQLLCSVEAERDGPICCSGMKFLKFL